MPLIVVKNARWLYNYFRKQQNQPGNYDILSKTNSKQNSQAGFFLTSKGTRGKMDKHDFNVSFNVLTRQSKSHVL